jgi:hypothetical protein
MSGVRGAVLFLAMSAACWSSSASEGDRSDSDRHEAIDDGRADWAVEDFFEGAGGEAEAEVVPDDADTADASEHAADGEADVNDDAVDVPSCVPPCPAGSECLDRDGVGAPECVWPSGELACAGGVPEDEYCPHDGYCFEGVCERWCSCVTDSNCGVDDVVCVNEDIGCGICALRGPYTCLDSSECRYVVDELLCCHCPKPRNAATVAADPCLVEYPPVGDPPPGCEPDCADIDHCWPCETGDGAAACEHGICRSVPRP